MSESLGRALEFHQRAARSLIDTVEAIPPSTWHEPIAVGKWSPALIVEHLIISYDVIIKELRGGEGMELRTRPWQRALLWLWIAPKILHGGAFPRAARAPRETRPRDLKLDQQQGLALFRERAQQLEEAARAAGPEQRVTHAYFGKATVANGVRFCSRHIEHHCAQLAHPPSPS